MDTPVAAYLRVYEPLAAFTAERAQFWRGYSANGRAVSTLDGPAVRRDLLYRSVGPQWDDFPAASDEAYVIDTEDGPLICPWQLRPRMVEAVRRLEDLVPPNLVDAFVSPRLTAEAFAGDWEVDSDPDEPKPSRWHEHIATWHVPTRWFVCLDDTERELSLSSGARFVRYRIPMARARRRARRAYGILQTSLGRGNPVAVATRHLCDWLSAFHPRATVEVDYGGLVQVMSDTELRDDPSTRLVGDGLAALSHGDISAASRCYERLTWRWRQIRLRERRN